jgi:hypothetical protein
MPGVQRQPLPPGALHERYARDGAYTDCYATRIDRAVSHEEFVAAFYTTWLFKLERWILSWSVKKPSTDAQARGIARGDIREFAAWTEEARTPDQLLMCDFLGHTRSWFRVSPQSPRRTTLYFGSVVTSRVNPKTGQRELGRSYRALLGFHKLYSRALLAAARARLSRMPRSLVRER